MSFAKIKLPGIIVLILMISSRIYSQQVDIPYEVATWQGFKHAAISYTFDDNCANQLALAVPMFDKYNFKLTLFTVIDWSPNWEGLQKAASNGHEIASHTVTHTSFSGMPEDKQDSEMKDSRDAINSHISGQKCVTIAYPYCATGNMTLVPKYYIAARGCQGYIENKTPANFENISSIICGELGAVKTVADFNSRAERADSSNGWCVYLVHGIDNDGGYSPLPSDTLEKSLEYLKANEGKFWVATFADVVRYIRERNSVKVSETSVQRNKISVQVTDTLDNNYYDHTITIRRPLPDGWRSAGVTQNGKTVLSRIIEINFKRYVMFDAVPDNGEVLITKNEMTNTKDSLLGSVIPDIHIQ